LIYGDDRYGDGGSLSGAKDLDIMGLACPPKYDVILKEAGFFRR
jgi:hypothetical protein